MSTDTYTDAWLCPECYEQKSQTFDPALTDHYDPETEDGFRAFDTSPCWLCGTTLAGYRIRFAYWGAGVNA